MAHSRGRPKLAPAATLTVSGLSLIPSLSLSLKRPPVRLLPSPGALAQPGCGAIPLQRPVLRPHLCSVSPSFPAAAPPRLLSLSRRACHLHGLASLPPRPGPLSACTPSPAFTQRGRLTIRLFLQRKPLPQAQLLLSPGADTSLRT